MISDFLYFDMVKYGGVGEDWIGLRLLFCVVGEIIYFIVICSLLRLD